jgi:xanthine dehydrogenase small subunit
VTLREGVIAEARIAYGGMAAIPKRATGAEVALLGKAWGLAAVRSAMQALAADFAPIDDMRASAAYRGRVAAALLERFFEAHSPQGARAPQRVEELTAIAS